ncbi:hypothetical protein [Streptomyces sp. PU-14G]
MWPVKEMLRDWSVGYRPTTELAEDIEALVRKARPGSRGSRLTQ